ncbi:MAG: SDR family oxidoreductase [Clostridiales bacterium]|nr:SDR family oxidoreductase [Clostridiales bacterium]
MTAANKNVIITGSNRGIGKALLKEFAERNYNIWACARNENIEFEKEITKLSEKYNVLIKPVYFDLSKEDEIKTGIKDIISEGKNIDALINNAGVPHGGLLSMTSLKSIREVYEINVFAQILITQLVSRKMTRQRNGSIVNMCSVGGIEHNPGYLAYGSSKAALIWITKSIAKELAPLGIRVNGIAPGLVETDMGHYKSDDEMAKVIGRTPMKRMGKPDEIAKAAVFLASDEASYITGHIIVVDGGRL